MQVKWLSFLETYQTQGMSLVYQSGKTNMADPLSRHPSYVAAVITRRVKRLRAQPGHSLPGPPPLPEPPPLPGPLRSTPTPTFSLRPGEGESSGGAEQASTQTLPGPPPVSPDLIGRIKQGYQEDLWCRQTSNTDRLTHLDGFWFSRGDLVVPNRRQLKIEIVYEFLFENREVFVN
jgi:hypothetical protein